MKKLVDIAGKKYVGGHSNKVIQSATTANTSFKGVLSAVIESSAELKSSVKYKGSIIDMNEIKGVFSFDTNIRFRLDEINLDSKIIKLNDLENTIKETYKDIDLGSSREFQEELKNYCDDDVILMYEGYVKKSDDDKLGVKISSIIYDSNQTTIHFDIKGVEDVTRGAFTKLLKENPKIKTKTIKEVSPLLQEKYRSKSAILQVYDGEIEEESPITQVYKTGITRLSNVKSEHVRHAHKKCYKTISNQVREIAIAPTVIHINDYSEDDLKNMGFQSSGEPTLEALMTYRGRLSDVELRRLNDENKYKTMMEVYGVLHPSVNYADLNKIFD